MNESAVAPLHHLATVYFRCGNDTAAENLYRKVKLFAPRLEFCGTGGSFSVLSLDVVVKA